MLSTKSFSKSRGKPAKPFYDFRHYLSCQSKSDKRTRVFVKGRGKREKMANSEENNITALSLTPAASEVSLETPPLHGISWQ